MWHLGEQYIAKRVGDSSQWDVRAGQGALHHLYYWIHLKTHTDTLSINFLLFWPIRSQGFSCMSDTDSRLELNWNINPTYRLLHLLEEEEGRRKPALALVLALTLTADLFLSSADAFQLDMCRYSGAGDLRWSLSWERPRGRCEEESLREKTIL